MIPSNFFAVTSLRKAAEILVTVNKETAMSEECVHLAQEVEDALRRYAVCNHPSMDRYMHLKSMVLEINI